MKFLSSRDSFKFKFTALHGSFLARITQPFAPANVVTLQRERAKSLREKRKPDNPANRKGLGMKSLGSETRKMQRRILTLPMMKRMKKVKKF